MIVRRLFERHYPRLVRYLYRRLGDLDRAEELAQETFVRLLERRPRRPEAWLYAVAANLARDAARSDARRARRLRVLEGL
ncbi:MAG: RNA polymerase sigma factor, partial [Gemmatimonadota bacterium]